jgi:DNA-binding CsgD family transcriptional regulator
LHNEAQTLIIDRSKQVFMKLSCRYLYIWIFWIATLLLGACTEKTTKQFKFNTQTFDEARVDLYFRESSEAEQLAPDLSPHEIRICALMRLHISSKEMAILTNRTQGTIDNTRSVIRKKLHLDDHVNLQEYILAI